MSMLTSLADRFRRDAKWLRKNCASIGFDHPIIADSSCEMEEAAETIMTLRNTCHDLQAENEELRRLVADMFGTFCCFREEPMSDSEELGHSISFWKRLDRLGIEVSR